MRMVLSEEVFGVSQSPNTLSPISCDAQTLSNTNHLSPNSYDAQTNNLSPISSYDAQTITTTNAVSRIAYDTETLTTDTIPPQEPPPPPPPTNGNVPNGGIPGIGQFTHKRNTNLKPDDFIRINVCGTVYQPLRSTLARFPETLLADEKRLKVHFVEFMDAYYFDRQRECFDAILFYYQSGGNLIRPQNIPMDLFAEEAKFFGIDENVFKNLQKMEGYVAMGYDETVEPEDLPTNLFQRAVWQLMEHPDSSVMARVLGMITILVIVVSVCSFCLETVPLYHDLMFEGEPGHDDHDERESTVAAKAAKAARANLTGEDHGDEDEDMSRESKLWVVKAIKYVEVISIGWFTVEYLVRFASSPHKWKFFKNFMNLIDLLAIIPFFVIQLIDSESGSPLAVVRVARLMRVLRVFKLSRHSKGLQVLGNALAASLNELGMIVFLLCFSIIVFSSAIYYAEYDKNKVSTFESIPNTFWYTLVTMTTVGYGDHVPLSFLGKCLGGLCAVAGVLTVAMVVPVIESNFEFFYKRDHLNAAKEENVKLLTMAHANEVDQNFKYSTLEITEETRL